MPANFLRAIAQLVHLAIHFYIFLIIIRSVISWMGHVPPHPLIFLLRRLTDPVFRLVHRTLPFTIISGIDISPIIIILALYLIDGLVTGLLVGHANRLAPGIGI